MSSMSDGSVGINKIKNVDPEKIKEELKKFEDLEEKLKSIKEWTDMSTKKTLKPFDFYDGVILELEDYDAFQTKFVDELKKFEEFVGKIKKADLSGGMGSAVPIAVSDKNVAATNPSGK